MKAALIHEFKGIEQIRFEETTTPTPNPDEVQIAVQFGGINPVDWKIAEGAFKGRMEYKFPIILGWDVSGTISAVGQNVTGFKIGDPVYAYCRKEMLHDGSYADFICLEAKNVAHKPQCLTFAQAAAIPLSSLTAWQTLDLAQIKAGETILIHAGAGGVGGYAIQFAKLRGAHVITTASKENFDYVKERGADTIIDYRSEDFVERIHKCHPEGVDIVFDTVGKHTLIKSYQAVKEAGKLITIAGVIDQELAERKNLFAEFLFVTPNGPQLDQISDLIDQKKVIPPSVRTIPFYDLEPALHESREGHVQGKLVLQVN